MKKVLHRRPSASMLVAITALVVASSGTAVAASSLVSGDKLIKKHSLSGNRLRNHTITGTQMNLGKLGKVPSAKNADHATTASSATTATSAAAAVTAASATNATNAANATNATNLGGQPASAYLPSSALQSSGTVTVTAGTTGKQMGASGPFSVTMNCAASGGVTTATVNFTSTVGNWLDDSNETLTPSAGTSTLGTADDSASKGAPSFNGVFLDYSAPAGAQLDGQWTFGVNWPTVGDCFYTGFTLT